LKPGDHLLIPAHCRHRVASVSGDAVWLALHADARLHSEA
jgi:cupin 2 domain-containing protein